MPPTFLFMFLKWVCHFQSTWTPLGTTSASDPPSDQQGTRQQVVGHTNLDGLILQRHAAGAVAAATHLEMARAKPFTDFLEVIHRETFSCRHGTQGAQKRPHNFGQRVEKLRARPAAYPRATPVGHSCCGMFVRTALLLHFHPR